MELKETALNYKEISEQLKTLTDPNRLMIIEMLSCGELCACEILEKLHITQPTLSHHMKSLSESNIVKSRKEGKNTYYQLNQKEIESLNGFLQTIFKDTENCICKGR